MKPVNKTNQSSKSFTLIELLVVMTIVIVFMGILLSSYASAKQAAKNTDSISNMKQCYLALDLYANDNDGWSNMPHDIISSGALAKAPTCDPSDYWRSSCKEAWGPPLVGSYAYAGYEFDMPWNTFHFTDVLDGKLSKSVPIMADIFVSDYHPVPFHGTNGCFAGSCMENRMPDKAIFLFVDGHCKLEHMGGYLSLFAHPTAFMGFSWPTLFMDYLDPEPINLK